MTLGATMAGIEAVRTMLTESAATRLFLGVATPAEALEKTYSHWLPDEDLKADSLATRVARRPWICVREGTRYDIKSSGVYEVGRIFTSTAVIFERIVDQELDDREAFSAFHNEIDAMVTGLLANQSLGSMVDIAYAAGGQPMRFEEASKYPPEVEGDRPQSFEVFCCAIEVQLNGGMG